MPGSQMTPASARAVDQILTEHALGYREPNFVGYELFPHVDVGVHGGKLLDFGDETTETVETLRAPGADAAEIQLKYSTKSYALEVHGLDAVVPVEIHNDAEAAPVRSLGERAVNRALLPVNRNLEIAHAAIARDPNNYAVSHKLALSGGAKWDTATGDPSQDVDKAIDVVELDCGRSNLVVMLGSKAFSAAKQNPNLKSDLSDGERKIITPEKLASLWNVRKVIVGRSLKKVGDVRQRIWGNDVIIAYVPENGSYDEPSFGYTFRLKGLPVVRSPYWREKNRSWIYPVDAAYQAKQTMPEAGYLLQNVTD